MRLRGPDKICIAAGSWKYSSLLLRERAQFANRAQDDQAPVSLHDGIRADRGTKEAQCD